MDLQDLDNFEYLSNRSEKLIFEILERELESVDGICLCDDCVLDMLCYSLNHIKPKYSVSLMGSIYASAFTDEEEREAEDIVKTAIKKIGRNPLHEK